MMMIWVFCQDRAEEGAVAQSRRRLVGQRVAGGAHGTLLAFALKTNTKVNKVYALTKEPLSNRLLKLKTLSKMK
jgi:hypothetical protein